MQGESVSTSRLPRGLRAARRASRFGLIASAFALAMTLATTANAQVISWNLDDWGTVGNPDGSYDNTMVAGVVPVVGWQNSWWSNPTTDLYDDSGTVTTLDIAYQSYNTYNVSGAGVHPGQDTDGTYNRELLHGYLNAGYAPWGPPITYSEVVFNEIPYGTYDIYVYFSCDVAGREGDISDGTTTYSFNTVGPNSVFNPSGNAAFFQTTDTLGTYTTAANYAVFSGLTGFSQTVQVQMRDDDEWAGIAGFQLVEVGGFPPGYWDGDSSGLWSVAANWNDDALPSFTGFTDTLTFSLPAAAGGTLTNDIGGAQLAGIAFSPVAPAFTLDGNDVEISDSLYNVSVNTEIVALNLIATNPITIYSGSAPLEISGVLSGTAGFEKSGAGSLVLSNTNDISGPITYAETGNIVIGADGALGDPNSILELNGLNQGPMGTLAFDGGYYQMKTIDMGSRDWFSPAHLLATSGTNVLDGSISGGDGAFHFIAIVDPNASLEIAADMALTPDQEVDLIRLEGDGDVIISGGLDDSAANSELGVWRRFGTGTLALVGPKAYSGPTWCDKGVAAFIDPNSTNNVPNSWILQAADPNATLDFSGLMGGGIVLADGQTLSGGGNFVGAVTAASGSVLSPGWLGADDIGVMLLPDLALTDGAEINIQVSPTEGDEIVIGAGGTLVGPSTGAVAINVDASAGFAATDYVLMDWSAATTVTSVNLADFTTNVGSLSIVGSQLLLTIPVVSRGDVLVSDTGNNRVQKYNATQFGTLNPDPNQSTFAEGVIGGFALLSPTGLAKNSAGHVFVAESEPNEYDRVLELEPNGGYFRTVAEVDSLDPNKVIGGTPEYLVVDPTDSYLFVSITEKNALFVSDPNLDDVIYRVDLSGATAPVIYIDTTDVGGNYILQDPKGLEFGPDGYLYISNNLVSPGDTSVGSLSLTNANFDTGAPAGDETDVDSWFDGTAPSGQDAFHISYNTPNGTPMLGLSNVPTTSDPNTGAWAYQSLGTDGSINSLPVEFDWGTFTDRDGQDLGITVSVYEVTGAFDPNEAVDIDGAAGVALLDRQSVTALDTSFGAYFADEQLTMDVSGQSGGELFIRFNNFNPPGADAECWAVVDNVTIGASIPNSGSRVLRFDVSGSTGVYAGSLTTGHAETKGLFYDYLYDRLLVSLNQLNDIWAYTDLTQDNVSNDPANGAFEYVYQQDEDVDYPDVVSASGEVFFTDATNGLVWRVDGVNAASLALGAAAGLINPHSLLVTSEVDVFDFDNDGDVDSDDLNVMTLALSGPGVTTPPLGVTQADFDRADFDNDGDVDMDDLQAFQQHVGN